MDARPPAVQPLSEVHALAAAGLVVAALLVAFILAGT